MRRLVSFRDFDWVLLSFVLAICALGVLEIYSTTSGTKFAGAHIRQVYWILFGLGLMFLVSMINYQVLLEFSETGDRDASLSDVVKAGLMAAIPMALVLKQPDLGTALTYVPVAAMALFLGGIQARHALMILLVAGVLMPTVWKFGLKSYQKERLTTFLHPEADSKASGYQLQQSKIAVGSGGIWGKGIGRGTQTQGSFLPEPHTDFIFAAWSEEHGFIGAVALLLLYFLVLMRLIHNAQTAPDRAGGFVVMGVVAVLLFHILVNAGMVVGFMPVTGIPLPLMSYGGSSLLFMFLALGIVMNIRMRRFVN